MLIDVLVIAVLLISILIAFFRGFIREVLTIFGLFGAGLVALMLAPMLEPALLGALGPGEGEEPGKVFGVLPYPLFAKLLAYGLIFIGFLIIFSILSHFLSDAAAKIGLGALDRSLGALFGLVRGVLLIALLYLPFHFVLDKTQKESWLGQSLSYAYLEWLAGRIVVLLPGSTAENAEEAQEVPGENKTPAFSLPLSNVERLIRGQQQNERQEEQETSPSYDKRTRQNMDTLIDQYDKDTP